MNNNTLNPRIDRLYSLLPAIYRTRDAEQGYPLQALLRVIAEQVNLIEDDIGQLYDNWFIETAQDWAVPYIGDLIGYDPAADTAVGVDASPAARRALNRVLVPRREVANTIAYRRRKGTLAVLEQIAMDVAGWPARAVEFFKLLGWTQNINHLHFERAHMVDVRKVADLELVDGPFDRLSHSVDVRRINSRRRPGRYNIPSVGVFVWRLKSYSVTHAPAYCAENAGPHCYVFSVLGQDTPLFVKPLPEEEPTHIAEELNLPTPIRRQAFARSTEDYYGQDRSFVIWAEGWAGHDPTLPLPASVIIAADLTDWQYVPPHNFIAVDPHLGRMVFPPGQLPKKGVRVNYHYGFSADMGGGEYFRQLREPSPRIIPDPAKADATATITVMPSLYRVGDGQEFHNIGDALRKWQAEQPYDAVIELTDSSVYVEPIYITLAPDQTLQLRAANEVRPVLRLLDWQTDLPDALAIRMSEGSRFVIDGLLITGRAMQISGIESKEQATAPCGAEVVIRHCTLVPGWGIGPVCEPKRPAEPSLELYNVRARVCIESSILGSIQINEDEVSRDPIRVDISNSILDATAPKKEALGAPGYAVAHAILTMRNCTVFGTVDVHAVELAENSIFNDCVNVARRQLGCMRFCYVPPGCRTPRRYNCQPDMVVKALRDEVADVSLRDSLTAGEQLRIRPQFTAHHYGRPGYAQLAQTCAAEIKRGADDESEMGAFHDLFQPQREDNLRSRLEVFTPAGMDIGVILVT